MLENLIKMLNTGLYGSRIRMETLKLKQNLGIMIAQKFSDITAVIEEDN